jgi:hypothetical protein
LEVVVLLDDFRLVGVRLDALPGKPPAVQLLRRRELLKGQLPLDIA